MLYLAFFSRTQWKDFLRKEGAGNKRKERAIREPGYLCFGGREGEARGKAFYQQMASPFCGDGEGPWNHPLPGARPEKSRLCKLYFWERQKLRLDPVLQLGLVSWALAEVTSFWACGFFSEITYKSLPKPPNKTS